MNLQQLKKLYLDCSRSSLLADRQRAKGYSELIKLFSNTSSKEFYEDVKLSLIAENFLKESEALYKATSDNKYRWYMKAANDCIIRYATDTDIQHVLLNYEGSITELAIYRYLNNTIYKNRVKYSSIHTICNVMNISNNSGSTNA